jgi:transcriptional regulator with XRE-family HTH domain
MNINADTIKKLEKISGEKLTFSSLIVSIRLGEELSQVDFAKILGVSKQYLCDVEHDRRSVSIPMAAEWAKKLEYSPDQFVRLAIQDVLDKSKLNMIINVKAA